MERQGFSQSQILQHPKIQKLIKNRSTYSFDRIVSLSYKQTIQAHMAQTYSEVYVSWHAIFGRGFEPYSEYFENSTKKYIYEQEIPGLKKV